MPGHPTAEYLEQYEALRSSAGYVDVRTRTQIEVTGTDRASFLHSFCTNNVEGLENGQGCEAFFTNVKGKIVGHGYIFCEPQRLIIESVAGAAATLIAHLDRYLIREDVQLVDRSQQWAELLIAGSEAQPMLEQLTSSTPPADPLCHAQAAFKDIKTAIRRVTLLGNHSFLISCDGESLESIARLLDDSGARPCDEEAVETRRIESGWPTYGIDITDENLPQEVGRDSDAIHFNKGCYLGQETVARIDALGHVNQQLVGLKLNASARSTTGTNLHCDGKEAGRITSIAQSPTLKSQLALAYVRRGFQSVGTRLNAGEDTAEVVALPLD